MIFEFEMPPRFSFAKIRYTLLTRRSSDRIRYTLLLIRRRPFFRPRVRCILCTLAIQSHHSVDDFKT